MLESLPQILAEARSTSESNCRGFLRAEFDPYRQSQAPVQSAVSIAEPGGVDLLRAVYIANGFQVRFYGNVSFSRLDLVPLDRFAHAFEKPNELLKYVSESLILAQAPPLHDWAFVIPDDATPPIHVTNIGASEVSQIRSRHDRLDIMMSKDAVHIQYYNKIHQHLHYLPADQWFNADVRRLFGRNRQ